MSNRPFIRANVDLRPQPRGGRPMQTAKRMLHDLPKIFAKRKEVTDKESLLFVRRILGPRRRVELPDGLPGREILPPYLLQEFHHLPNGTYSEGAASAYTDWFDRVMLGVMRTARQGVARALSGCEVVLDAGCGAGGLAGILRAGGLSGTSAVSRYGELSRGSLRRCRLPHRHCVRPWSSPCCRYGYYERGAPQTNQHGRASR
jgi:hypothetical protein